MVTGDPHSQADAAQRVGIGRLGLADRSAHGGLAGDVLDREVCSADGMHRVLGQGGTASASTVDGDGAGRRTRAVVGREEGHASGAAPRGVAAGARLTVPTVGVLRVTNEAVAVVPVWTLEVAKAFGAALKSLSLLGRLGIPMPQMNFPL